MRPVTMTTTTSRTSARVIMIPLVAASRLTITTNTHTNGDSIFSISPGHLVMAFNHKREQAEAPTCGAIR